MEKIFFDNWESIIRTLVITILAYICLIALLRISGKRTLSQMNAFDFIITIALGSTFATVALNKDVALADGVLAFFLLIFLQYTITALSVRYKFVKNIITSKPALLLYRGELLMDALKKERITIEEVNVAVRKKGIEELKDVDAIILETEGEITVVPKLNTDDAETLQNVKNIKNK
jgi:uncharacterized membrane protein YcaP (DUF421 family)